MLASLNDSEKLASWWRDRRGDVTADVRGLWFGLFTGIGPDNTEHFAMYVAGTPAFDPGDGGDWACDYVWLPEDRYLRLDGLASIPIANWPAAVEHVLSVVRKVAPWDTAPESVLGAGVGFDDGDMHVVWMRT